MRTRAELIAEYEKLLTTPRPPHIPRIEYQSVMHCIDWALGLNGTSPSERFDPGRTEEVSVYLPECKEAWYSQMAVDSGHGTAIWRCDDGTEVEITAISAEDDYKWPDKQFMGCVTEWVRDGKTPQPYMRIEFDRMIQRYK